MTEPSHEREYDEVYDGPDPDVQSIEEAASEQDDEDLTTYELRPEEEATEFEPPPGPSTPTSDGLTPLDQEYGETIDDRLAQEEPEEEP